MKQHHHSLRDILRYRFDTLMSRRGGTLAALLALAAACVVVVIGLVRFVALIIDPHYHSEASRHVLFNIYYSFLQMADPGNMALDLDAPVLMKITGVIIGLVGLVMFSGLIAVVTTALDEKLRDLRKGHSKVIEDGHTLILGWNDQRVLEIARELIEANRSEDDAALVVLSEMDKEEMDEFLHVHLEISFNTRIITRSGSVSSLVNLEIVSVSTAKSVIVLADCHESASEHERATSDAQVMKAVLAVLACGGREAGLTIVAELFDNRNRSIVEALAPEQIITVDTEDILARILVQTSRSHGLALVYNEILSFHGSEFYFIPAQRARANFSELKFCFTTAIPVGLFRQDGQMLFCPEPSTAVNADDTLIVLAQDDSAIELRDHELAKPTATLKPMQRRRPRVLERELIIGWTAKAHFAIRQFDDYLLPGSAIDVMLYQPQEAVRKELLRLDELLPNLRVSLIEKDPLNKDNLLSLNPSTYDNIIILGEDSGHASAERSDANTLIILLFLRDLLHAQLPRKGNTKLIAEVLESRNKELVNAAGVDNFIISNQIISMIMAQMSEHKNIDRVYEHLFKKEGFEIYIKPAALYLDEFQAELSFLDLMCVTEARNEICLGIKRAAYEHDLVHNCGIELNPPKSAKFRLKPEDALIVLAEDET